MEAKFKYMPLNFKLFPFISFSLNLCQTFRILIIFLTNAMHI